MARYLTTNRLIMASLLLVASTPITAAEFTGLWETTVVTSMPGMPFAPPPVTSRNCVTEDNLVPQSQDPSADCKIDKQSISGNTLSWSIQCNSQGMHTVSHGSITYSGNSFSGSSQISMKGGPMGNMEMSQTLSGRRLGNCP